MMAWYERERSEMFSSGNHSAKDLSRHPAIDQTAAIWAYCNQHEEIKTLVVGTDLDGVHFPFSLSSMSLLIVNI